MDSKNANVIEIYHHCADQISKDFFIKRLLYSITERPEYLYEMIRMTDTAKWISQKIEDSPFPQKVIFGAGYWGRTLKEVFSQYQWDYFLDNKIQETVSGIPVVSWKDVDKILHNTLFVISSRSLNVEMKKELIEHGVKENQIINVGQLIENMFNNQYFDLKAIHYDTINTFVDAGCFDGSTAKHFSEWNPKWKQIWAFEPDPQNFKNCKAYFSKKDEWERAPQLYQYGLWNKSGKLGFCNDGSVGAKIASDSDYLIETAALDELIGDQSIEMIKMDIEGAEYFALQGTKNIISKQKPRLAISVYHKLEDIIMIPQLLLELNPEYQLYLRHYSLGESDTILYAI